MIYDARPSMSSPQEMSSGTTHSQIALPYRALFMQFLILIKISSTKQRCASILFDPASRFMIILAIVRSNKTLTGCKSLTNSTCRIKGRFFSKVARLCTVSGFLPVRMRQIRPTLCVHSI